MSPQNNDNELNTSASFASSEEESVASFEDFATGFDLDDASNDDFTEVIVEGRKLTKAQQGEYLDGVVLASGVQALQSERFREKTRSVRAAQRALDELQRQGPGSPAQHSKVVGKEAPREEATQAQSTASSVSAPETVTHGTTSEGKKKEEPVPFGLDDRDENSDKRRHHYSKSRSKFSRRWRRLKKWQRAIIIFLLVLFLLVFSLAATVYLMHQGGKKQVMDANVGVNFENSIIYDGVEYIYNNDITSVAFFGVDKRSLDLKNDSEKNAGQNDVNMVVSLDTKTGKTNIIVIPRDAIVDVNKYSVSGDTMGTAKQQLCLAYSYGDGAQTSCENAIASVQRLLYGIPINTYVALDLDGIAPLNEAVGGVKFITPTDYEEYKKGEEITVTANLAEHYIRSREHTLTGDAERRERQIAYVKAFISKAADIALTRPASLTEMYNTGKAYALTNLTLSRSLYFGTVALSNTSEILSFENVQTLKGKLSEDSAGYVQTIIDDDAALKTVLDIYYTPLK